jgi:hypothetical protein
MGSRLLSILVGLTALGVLAGGTGSAASATGVCTPSLNTTAAGLETVFCGPARAQVVLAGKRYEFRGGTCEVKTEHGNRVFSVDIGRATDPWPGKPTKGHYVGISIKSYRGGGTYSIAGDRAGLSIVLTPYPWRTIASKIDQQYGAAKAWAVGKVTMSNGGMRGRFAVPVEAPPGGNLENAPDYPAWLSVRVTGAFSCR